MSTNPQTPLPTPVANPLPVAIFVRVSTRQQETARQVHELSQYALSQNYHVIATVLEEGVSGSSQFRPGLDEILHLAKTRQIKKVLVHEVSRLGRNAARTLTFVEELHSHQVSLFWFAQHMETLLPDGRRSPAAGIMLALMAEMARAETDQLSERIRSGLEEARRKGKRLGRAPGPLFSPSQLLRRHQDVVRALTQGQSIRHAALITRKGPFTVQRVKKAMASAMTMAKEAAQ